MFGGITIFCGILGTLAGGLILDAVSATINNAFKVSSACFQDYDTKISSFILLLRWVPTAAFTASRWSDNSRCNILLQCVLCKEFVYFYSSFLTGRATSVFNTGNLQYVLVYKKMGSELMSMIVYIEIFQQMHNLEE